MLTSLKLLETCAHCRPKQLAFRTSLPSEGTLPRERRTSLLWPAAFHVHLTLSSTSGISFLNHDKISPTGLPQNMYSCLQACRRWKTSCSDGNFGKYCNCKNSIVLQGKLWGLLWNSSCRLPRSPPRLHCSWSCRDGEGVLGRHQIPEREGPALPSQPSQSWGLVWAHPLAIL